MSVINIKQDKTIGRTYITEDLYQMYFTSENRIAT